MEKTDVKEKKIKEKELQNNNEKKEFKRKNKLIVTTITIVVSFFILMLFSTIFALLNMNNEKIVSGIKIEEIDVSGLSAEEAKNKINDIYSDKEKKDILLKYKDYDTIINTETLEVKFDIDKAVNEAIKYGKEGNIIKNNYNILIALIKKKNINIDMSINEENAKKAFIDIEINIPGAVEEPEYSIEEDKLIITKGKEGIKIDTEKLMEIMKEILKSKNNEEIVIDIPVINKKPEKIDIEKIHEEIYKEVQDAYYTKEPFTIHPEVEGIDFDIEEAKKILEEDKEQYEINLKITKPKVTIAQIGSEAFPDLIATFSTRYDGGDVDRTTNLRIACQKINDKVVLPGETFSYNNALGKRTASAGYRNAKVYENVQVVDGIGGGICQISSTLYNAILMANMETVERRNHQFVTSYLPAGRDATVVYGLTDFKFKNTRNYAIRIRASASNGVATVSIYGIKEENEYTVSFSTRTISTIPLTIKYVEDNNLAAGTEKITQKGTNGIITETYITKSLNGKVVSSKLLSKDTYNAMQRIIARGTNGAITEDKTTNNQEIVTNLPNNNETKPNSNEEQIKEDTSNNNGQINQTTEQSSQTGQQESEQEPVEGTGE